MPPKKSVIAETAAAVRGMELSVIEDIRNLNELPKIKEVGLFYLQTVHPIILLLFPCYANIVSEDRVGT